MSDNQNLTELPKSWEWATFEDIGADTKNAIVDGPFGSNLKLSDYIDHNNGIPVLTTKNLEKGHETDNLRYISFNKFDELHRSEVRGGDILLAKIGSCGKHGIYPDHLGSAMIPANLMKITVRTDVNKLLVSYYLDTLEFKKQLATITTATAQPAFGISKFKKLLIPLPPQNEQQRIVDKVEELFTDLDAGVEALQRAKTLLKRYRQSVLKAAVTGELTKEWREAHEGDIEQASVLLERILADRRKKWEEEQRLKETDQLRQKYIGPVEPEINVIHSLPKEWIAISLDQLSYHVTSGSRGWAKYYSDNGSIFIRVGNFNRFDIKLDLSNLTYVNAPEGLEEERTRVKLGDILLTITADVGMISLVDNEIAQKGKGYINQHVSLIRPLPSVFANYIAYALTSEVVQVQIRKRQYGVTKKGLGLEDVKLLSVPFPADD